MPLMNIADLVDTDDPKGRTYREINAAKKHTHPIGTLVELVNGCRLYIVKHTRDCDQTPMYSLGCYKDRPLEHGYVDDSLTVIDR